MNDPAGRRPRVLIVCDSASAAFGGEAILPVHYFRVLRKLGVPVWLVTHARTRAELSALFPGDTHIRYVEDTALDRLMWSAGRFLPARLAVFTVGFVARLRTQLIQRKLARSLVREERIDVVHQPVPVSPKEPSLLRRMGAPVVIGPMNGGMTFPPAFRSNEGHLERVVLSIGRACASALSHVMRGKREAALLLVANERTRRALPSGVSPHVAELVENGVDLALWSRNAALAPASEGTVPTFVFMGRLVDWKAVDLLLEAFVGATVSVSMKLLVIGDGTERKRLEALAGTLGLGADRIEFTGWLPQHAASARLELARCLVLPSLYECGGAVVLEAMSLGKPVIATAWGGPTDYLDETCGILVEPSSREAFVDGLRRAMIRLAQDPAECARLGANGLAKVRAEYDWEIKVMTMLEHYGAAMRV